MQDKEIRKILIEYLKIQHDKYRIYQEKSIGSSICDLMLVTDKLTGFEIKSDSDNYERLPRQIAAYNHFFDENYIDEEQKQLDLRREKTTQNAEYVEKNIVDLRTGCSSIAEIVTSKLGAFSHDREIAKIGEFSLRFPHTQSEKKQFLIFERLNTEYYVEFGDSISGNKTRLSNFFEKFKNQVTSVEKRYDELEEKKENLKNQIQYCSGIEKKIKKLEDEKQVLFDKLSVKKE